MGEQSMASQVAQASESLRRGLVFQRVTKKQVRDSSDMNLKAEGPQEARSSYETAEVDKYKLLDTGVLGPVPMPRC